MLSDISSHANPELWIWSPSVMSGLAPILLCPGEEINLFVALGEALIYLEGSFGWGRDRWGWTEIEAKGWPEFACLYF